MIKAAPLRGTTSGAPRAGRRLGSPAQRARADPAGAVPLIQMADSLRELRCRRPSSSLSIIRLAATASRAALRAVACDRLRRP
jgi:hypothetical protein